MIKRRDPDEMFQDLPCAIVAVGTAMGKMPPKPEALKADGYLTLVGMDRYCRSLLRVKSKVQYRRNCRPTLRDFLEVNKDKAIVCVLGHFLYADRNTYWSFLRNANDQVVAVWYLDEGRR